MGVLQRTRHVHQAHVGAGHQRFDVHQDQHALAHAGNAGDETGVDRGVHLGRGLDQICAQFEHVRDGIDHRTHHPAVHVEHDHHREAVVFHLLAVELDAQIDHRHDHPAQVDHTFDETGRVGNAGGRFVGSDFLHPQDVDAVLLGTQTKGEKFGGWRLRCTCAARVLLAGERVALVEHVHGGGP